MKNNVVAILSEPEIEKYREFIGEVRTQLTRDEVRDIAPGKINRDELVGLGIIEKSTSPENA